MTTSRILVIGADGLIGSALMREFRARGDHVLGTTRRDVDTRSTDLIHLDLLAPVPALPQADIAFICAAVTKFAACRAEPGLARRINRDAPRELARQLVGRGTKIVFLSTSAVMDCAEPQMPPDRPRCGQSLYGRWKGEAEEAILNHGGAASVLRLTKVLTPDAALFRNWVTSLRRGHDIEAFGDLSIAPILLSDVVEAAFAVSRDSAGGVYQVSGARDVSYFELARDLAAGLGFSHDRVHECSASSRGIPPEDVPRFTSLDCSRLTALTGFIPPEPFPLLRALFLHADGSGRPSVAR